MRKILSVALALLLCGCLCVTAFASQASSYLIDDADLLTSSEETALEQKLRTISDTYGLDVVVLTLPSLDGQNETVYADDYYDYNGYRSDGILLLVSMAERRWAISTAGYGVTAFTDAGLAYMEDQFLEDLSSGNYNQAFHTFADVSEEMIIQAKSGDPYDYGNLPKSGFALGQNLVICLIIGFVIALIVTGVMRAQLKTVRPKPAAADYVVRGSLNVTEHSDLFLFRNISRIRKESNNRSGGSSTHTSSSGRSHGGRSGGF